MSITKEQFFKPGKVSAQDKASTTNQAARDILAKEASDRERKTDRLRQLRLEQQATIATPDTAKKPRKSVAGKP
ncbi:MAG: hypothetical protein DI589_25115 [Shinella sp.]|jgi:glutamine synthetase adenylyltransferase|nr:MAG: hypothetical protein DI589_25115 [Shinella sp.]